MRQPSLPALRLATALLTLVAFGCSASPGRQGAQAATEEIQQMLDRRADALIAGDMEGFLAPVASEHRRVEEPVAQRLLALPVEEVRFQIQPGSVRSEFPMTGVSAELSYRFEQTPEANTFSIPMTYGFNRGSQGPEITEVSIDTDELPSWFNSHTKAASTDHFLALHRRDAEGVQRVLEVAEQARTELQHTLPLDLDARFVMVLADGDVEYQQVTGRELLENLPRVAQTVTKFDVTPEEYLAHSRYMVVNLDRLQREGTGPQTFKHELVHLALAPVTRPITPGWVTEGAAMYVAGQRPNWTQRVTTGSYDSVNLAQLSTRSQLGGEGPSGADPGLEYAFSAGAAFYLVEQFDAETFWNFYKAYAQVSPQVIYDSLPSAGDSPAQGSLAELTARTTERLVEVYFEMSVDELDRAVHRYISAP